MPWSKKDLMSLREEFIHLAETQTLPVATLCQRFGISRKTGYKWLVRYRVAGRAGLADQSRRPVHVRPTVLAAVREALLADRRAHPCWGARKLRQRMQTQGLAPVPACSTITALLHREGFIGMDPAPGPAARGRFEHPVPNQLWQMDFKGAVPTVTGPTHPLTILDDHSRFNVGLRALPNQQTATVQQVLIETFRRYGLPDRLLVDNGSPWGSDATHQDTPLTVWLWRVGVAVTHSRPYHPQTLGKDERFHGTLTREVLRHAQWRDPAHLQTALDCWRDVYNQERPHEALGLAVPASRYQPSLRSYPEILPPIEYDAGTLVRKVQQKGVIHFQGAVYKVSKAFTGYPVGVRPLAMDGQYAILFGPHRIMTIDIREGR